MIDRPNEGRAWQVAVWNRMADAYQQEIDIRLRPVVEQLLDRADLRAGNCVLDLGTGTGALAIAAASMVGSAGWVTAVDISPKMLKKAQARLNTLDISNVALVEGSAEAIPSKNRTFDRVLASLSLMYVVDRTIAAQEIARVLRPGGRLVAAVWAGPEEADVVRFQEIADSFAARPPVTGVNPGALSDPTPFLLQLEAAGLKTAYSKGYTTFRFANFEEAWYALADANMAAMEPEVRHQAKTAVGEVMWLSRASARVFQNVTQFITATKPS